MKRNRIIVIFGLLVFTLIMGIALFNMQTIAAFVADVAAQIHITENGPAMVRIPGKYYEIGKYEVTQKEWRDIMGYNPSHFNSCGEACPVEMVSWHDVQKFIRKLNAKTGRHYRLPTEAEWEYACYGGNKTQYCGGNDIDSVAWYGGNSNNTTHPAGQKQANGYGLHDMSGNVWEWLQGNLDKKQNWHPTRGDSCCYSGYAQQPNEHAAISVGSSAETRENDLGFRLARTIPGISTSADALEQAEKEAISNEDLNDCSVLLGQEKNIVFQQYLSSVSKQADGGDWANGILYANIMHNRFSCYEDKILGEQTVRDKERKVVKDTPRKTIPSIQTHPVAFMALKEAVAAYTRIADLDVDARILLAQYYADYREVLGDSQQGYLLLSGAYEALCDRENIHHEEKTRCVKLKQQKLRFHSWISAAESDHLDQQARRWATEYLKNNNEASDTARDEDTPKPTAKLKGKDFELSVWGGVDKQHPTDPQRQQISIEMDDGKEATDIIFVDGEKAELQYEYFSPLDSFELKNLIPVSPREQLVVTGNEWLTDGWGGLTTYSIYRVEETGITNLLQLITGREVEKYEDGDPIFNRPDLHLSATIQKKIENGKLVIVYRYREDGGKFHTINFRWNGSAFIDAEGAYKKIGEKYNHPSRPLPCCARTGG